MPITKMIIVLFVNLLLVLPYNLIFLFLILRKLRFLTFILFSIQKKSHTLFEVVYLLFARHPMLFNCFQKIKQSSNYFLTRLIFSRLLKEID